MEILIKYKKDIIYILICLFIGLFFLISKDDTKEMEDKLNILNEKNKKLLNEKNDIINKYTQSTTNLYNVIDSMDIAIKKKDSLIIRLKDDRVEYVNKINKIKDEKFTNVDSIIDVINSKY